jgi:hypothetical protein
MKHSYWDNVTVYVDEGQKYAPQTVQISGVDIGRGAMREIHTDTMSVVDTQDGVMVLHLPGQDYFAGRWHRGYMPAHYVVLEVERKPDADTRSGLTAYSVTRWLANIPLRRGAVQKS